MVQSLEAHRLYGKPHLNQIKKPSYYLAEGQPWDVEAGSSRLVDSSDSTDTVHVRITDSSSMFAVEVFELLLALLYF